MVVAAARDDEGESTWDSLRGYVKRQVARDVPKLIGGGAAQRPEESGWMAGASPVLIPADAMAPARPPAAELGASVVEEVDLPAQH